MPRVLLMIDTMGGGGAERQLVHLASALPAFGWEVHVALCTGGERLESLEKTGAKIHFVRRMGRFDPIFLLRLLWRTARVRPDLVHTWLPFMDRLGGIVAITLRIPWIVGDLAASAGRYKTLKWKIRRRLARHAAAIVANSEAARATWATTCPAVPFFVVRSGMELDALDAAPPHDMRDFGAGDDTQVILAAGRYASQKDYPTLVKGLRTVLEKRDAIAVFCGGGPDTEALTRMIDELGLRGKIVLSGYRSDIWSLMKGSDVFVSSSLFEGHPNSVIEAAACGVPMVLSDIPTHREAVSDAGALFAAIGAPEEFARAIVETLDDREAAKARAAAAAAYARSFTSEAMAASYDKVVRGLLGRGGAVESARRQEV